MENRIRQVMDAWWGERREELLNRIVNATTPPDQEENNDEVHIRQTFQMVAHPFMETASMQTTDEYTRFGMNLLQFSINNIMNMFPEVPILPNPDSETDIHEVMSDQHRRANFFSSFTLPESLGWEMVTSGSLPIKKAETHDQECSICLDTIRKDIQVFSLVCGHEFHCHCLCRILAEPISPKCPLCRCEIAFTN